MNKQESEFDKIQEENLGQAQLADLLKNFEEVVVGTEIADDLKRDFIEKVLGMVGRAMVPNSQQSLDS